MATQTKSPPSTLVNDATVGVQNWSPLSFPSTFSDATGLLISKYLKITGFGFSIPVGATITQIDCTLDKIDPQELTTDNSAKYVVGGSVSGAELATGETWGISSGQDLVTYTITSSLPTVAQINATNFGFAISGNPNGSTDGGTIQSATIVVTYTPAAGGGTISQQRTKFNPDYYD